MFYLDIAAVTAAYVVVVIATEFIAPVERYMLRSRIRGLLFSVVNVTAGVWVFVYLQALWGMLGIPTLIEIPVRGWAGDAAAIMLSVLFSDFLIYWNHRFQHRFLWRVHSLHHCQTELHAANSYAHFTERSFRFLLFALPLSLIDFDFPAIPIVIAALGQILELYIHSPTSVHLGPLAKILVDNRFHRIHHSLEPRHFDKNFGVRFSFWDRLFGTAYEPAPGEWPAVGVQGLRPPRSLTDYLLFPLRQTPEPPDLVHEVPARVGRRTGARFAYLLARGRGGPKAIP